MKVVLNVLFFKIIFIKKIVTQSIDDFIIAMLDSEQCAPISVNLINGTQLLYKNDINGNRVCNYLAVLENLFPP
jgi:hypothetical protein